MKTYSFLVIGLLAMCRVVSYAQPTCGLTIITHGFQPNGTYLPPWVRAMEGAVITRIGIDVPVYRVRYDKQSTDSTSDDVIRLEDGDTSIDITKTGGAIILLDWADASDELLEYPTQDVADKFFNFLFEEAHSGNYMAELPIHLIGHSRGASLNTRLAYRLAQKGILIDQITSIDPHPSVDLNANDWGMATYINTIFADNYFQTEDAPEGQEVNGTFGQNLNAILNSGGLFKKHSQTHSYYHGTIDQRQLPYEVDGEQIVQAWYDNTRPRAETGFAFSRFGNRRLARLLNGISVYLIGAHGTGTRESVVAVDPWPNAGFDQRNSLPSRIIVGQTASIPYHFSDRGSEQTIGFFTDADTNPYKSSTTEIGSATQSSRPGGGIGLAMFPWTAIAADIGPSRYVGLRTTSIRMGEARVRYDYIFEPVIIEQAPSSLSGVAVSTSQINLTWADNSLSELGFKIERRLGTTGEWLEIAMVPRNIRNYSDTARSPNTTYSYRVTAYSTLGNSDYTPIRIVTTQPAAGTSYTLTIASANPSSGVGVNSFVGSGSFASGITPVTRSFVNGTVVGVTCSLRLPSGLLFQKWLLDGADYAFSDYTTVTMDRSHTLTVVYGSTQPPVRVLASLAIEGPSSVDERSSAQYYARATYTDGSSAYVTAGTDWDEDSGYAIISDAGLLDAAAVSSDRDVEIEATFTAGGVTRTAYKDVRIRNTDAVPTYTLTRSASAGGSIGYSPKGNSYAAGTIVSLHANEDDGYVFSHWSGDASGTEDDITIRMDGNRSVTAHFVVDTRIGYLRVDISPPLAVAEGAQWKYDLFTAWRDSGNTMTLSPRTNRVIHFKDIPGWITPAYSRASIVGGQTTVVTATYREILGAIQVNLSPVQANVAGARWRLDGGPWMESGVAIADVSTGTHNVDFFTIPGWATPPSQMVSVERGITTTRNGDYGPPAGFPIVTAVIPRSGSIAGGTSVTIDGVNFQSDAVVTFGGVSASSVTVVSPTQIIAVTPPRASYGTVALTLTIAGQTVTQPNGFSYLNALGSNIELVGQIGGNVEAVTVVGNTVYYGEGPGLVVADFSNSTAPVERGRIALPAVVKDIAVANNIAFVAVIGAGLYAVDVSSATAPSIVGFFDTEGTATGVAVSENIVYVADGATGLQILNGADPSSIERLGLFDTPGLAARVSVGTVSSRKYAFVAEGNLAMRVIDVTTPSAAVEVGSVPAQTSAGITDVKVSGTKLYVSDWQGIVKIFDASNLPSLVQIGYRDNLGGGPFIDVVGNRLYACAGNLRVADLTITPNPGHIGHFDVGPFCYDLIVANGLAFAAMGRDGLRVVDVSNAASMTLRSAIETIGGVEDVSISGDIVFVGNDSGLHTLDVSNPARPVRLATLAGDRVTDIVVAEAKATLVHYGSDTVRIANVANPSSLSLLGTYTGVEAWNVALLGNTPVLAAATKDAAHLPKLDVLNITLPSSPQSVGSLLLDSTNGIAAAVTVINGWAFIGRQGWGGNPNNGLDVVNLANPSSPQKVGTVSLPNDAFFLDIAGSEDGNYVYVGDWSHGIQVVDVSMKTAPALGQIINPPQTPGAGANSVEVVGNRLIATEAGFIFAFDISDAASPRSVGYYDIPGSGNGIAMTDDLILVAGGNAGVTILRLKDVDKPTIAITEPTANTAYATNATLFSLSGVASDDRAVVRVTWANNRGGGGIAVGTNDWQAADIQLGQGINVITVTAEDGNGNLAHDLISVTAIFPDTTPPVVSIIAPTPDSEFSSEIDLLALSGSAVDNQAITNVIWSNDRGGSGVALVEGENWRITDISLAFGPNVVQVTAVDASGNTGSDVAVIFFASPDTSAPVISIDFPTLNSTYETEFQMINLSGTATDDSTVTRMELSLSDGPMGMVNGTTVWSVNDILLEAGVNVIQLLAYDQAGNVGTDTLTVTYLPPPFSLIALNLWSEVFRFQVKGPPNSSFVVEASFNLREWSVISSNTLPLEGQMLLHEHVVGSSSARFYRVAGVP